MSKQKLFLAVLMVLSLIKSIAQKGSEQLLKVVPPSPNVASLGKYGEVPVSFYTGVPNISIPLYEIKDGSLELPISLSYHAGGIKVEEIAASVGLSWSLNAGGVLGRNVRGMPDEISRWNAEAPENTIENILFTGNSRKVEQLVTDIDKGLRDGEADIYYFNFNQFSGKFFYDQKGIVHTIPEKNILVNAIGNGWRITSEDGTVYNFDKVEQVNSVSCSPADQLNYTAWFLTSIKSPDGKREITFGYDKVNYTYETLLAQTKYFSIDGAGNNCMTNSIPCLGTQNYNTYRLTRINFRGGYINFNFNTVRYDLVMDKSLDEMEVYNSNDSLIKKFRFGYSYFGNNSDGYNIQTQNLKRLKLVSITEEKGADQKPPFLFEYNETIELPGRLSYSQDHWGYYNGKLNADLIASFTTTINSGQQAFFPGADRNANPATAQAGILTKIKYPTGGETSFTYESNTVSDTRVEPQKGEQEINFGASNQSVYSLRNPYESDELVIPEQGGQVQFNISGLGNNLWWGCDIVHCYVIKDNNPIPFAEISDGWNDATIFWQAGVYKLRLINECNVTAIANFSVTVRAQIAIAQTINLRPVGGLRIKQIEDNPGDGGMSMIKKYRYHPENDSLHSSGVLVNFPDYSYDYYVNSYKFDDRGNPMGPGQHCFYRVRQSFSNYPLATTQGSYVGYSHVIVDLVDNGESRYSFVAYSDLISPVFPFAPSENFDWTRGFLLNTKDFMRKDGGLILAKETINTPVSFNQVRMYGIKTGKPGIELTNGEVIPLLQPLPKYSFYPTITEFYALAQTKERAYDQNDPAKFIETITDYTYNPKHLQLVQSKTITSRGDDTTVEEIVSKKKYPFDYTFNGVPSGAEAVGIKKLQDNHTANAVIEEYVFKQHRNTITNKLSDQRIVDGQITTYKSDQPYPDQLFKLDLSSSIPLINFGNGSVLKSNAFFKNANAGIDSLFTPVVRFNSYDERGNITTQQKTADVKKSYVWGYNSQYPVAEIVGEDYTTIMAGSNINQKILQNDAATDEEIRTEMNKIRTNFPSALVSTYTYRPLVGIISQTDINNRSTYYEYDSFGRLILIRDQDKNILKKICYNYKGQPGNCVIIAGNR